MGSPDRQHTQVNDDFIAEDLVQMKLATNYFKWVFSFIRPYLGKRILEIGPGIGTYTREMLKAGDYVCGVEPNLACVNVLKKEFVNEERLKILPKMLEHCDPQELESGRFDTLFCCNVLEHIEDDRKAMLEFKKIIEKTGGKIIIFVPAMPSAYGSIDKSVGHFRRYSKPMIRKLMTEVELGSFSYRYVNWLGFLGWYFNAHILKRTKQSDAQIKLFDLLVPGLSLIEKVVPPPFGMSLFVVVDVPAKTG